MSPATANKAKYIKLAKIIAITVGTVYGGHKLVQYVTPTEEELLAVRQMQRETITTYTYLFFYVRDFRWKEGTRI